MFVTVRAEAVNTIGGSDCGGDGDAGFNGGGGGGGGGW